MKEFISNYEIRCLIENVYMLGGCKGETDQIYLEKVINRIIEIIIENKK